MSVDVGGPSATELLTARPEPHVLSWATEVDEWMTEGDGTKTRMHRRRGTKFFRMGRGETQELSGVFTLSDGGAYVTSGGDLEFMSAADLRTAAAELIDFADALEAAETEAAAVTA